MKKDGSAYECDSPIDGHRMERSKLCITTCVLREFAEGRDSIFKQFKQALEILKKKHVTQEEQLSLECCENPRGRSGCCDHCGGYLLVEPLGVNVWGEDLQ